MTAYLISETEVNDPSAVGRYVALAAPAVEAYGGRFLTVNATPDVPEGEWPDGRTINICEFPSLEKLREWYASAEYSEALEVSKVAWRRRMLFVRGLDELG